MALAWLDNANNETGFTIERSAGGAFVQVAQVGANVTTYLDSGLAANTAYDYRVAAFNGAGRRSIRISDRTYWRVGHLEHRADSDRDESVE